MTPGRTVEIETSLTETGIARTLGLGTLLVVGAVVVAGVGAADTSVGSGDARTSVGAPPTDAGVAQQETNNTTNVTVDVAEAMETAENETNGTAVGASLVRKGDVTDLERPTRVYEVDVLLPNETYALVDVNATDGALQQTRVQGNETGILEGVFGDDDELPSERPDPGAIRSGIEAVELVRNETGENGTITAVELNADGDRLQYVVEVVSSEGIRSTVIIAADPDEGGILTTDE